MKVLRDTIEQYALNVALVMFLVLCALSLLGKGVEVITVTRNLLFLLTGASGLLVAEEIGRLRRMRLAKRKLRTLYVAQRLLLAFALIILVIAIADLDLLPTYARWD